MYRTSIVPPAFYPPALCTLTGVDAATSMRDIVHLGRRFPQAEWGVLYNPGRRHGTRYPSRDEVICILRSLRAAGLPCALHLCGEAVEEAILGKGETSTLLSLPSRIQLNFLFNKADQFSLHDLEAFIAHAGRPIITQHHRANTLVTEGIQHPNHQVLFDTSGGRGRVPSQWPAPLITKPCGYAGGIGPGNVADTWAALLAMGVPPGSWVDMETYLRDDADRFDLARCERVLVALFGSPALAGHQARMNFGMVCP